MPSLWDLLCVSRPHNKYTTRGSKSSSSSSKRRPQHRTWDDPPYYDPSNVEYYIQPSLPNSRRPSLPSQGSLSALPPRSPNSRRQHRVQDPPPPHRGAPDPRAWYVEVRGPQPLPSPAARGGEGGDPLRFLKSGRESAEPPGRGGHLSGGRDLVDRDCDTAYPGKRRHVRDIFADVPPPQYQGNSHRAGVSTTPSVASSHQTNYWSERSHVGTSGSRQSSVSAHRSDADRYPRSRQISGSRQSLESAHHLRSGQSSPFPQPASPRQASPYRPQADSRQIVQSRHLAQPKHHHLQSRQQGQPRQPAQSKQYVQSRQHHAHQPRQHVQPRQVYRYPHDMGGASSWQSSDGLQTSAASRPRTLESMHQYSPRTVSDGAISAALFGGRIDDFVHDPGWNKAINRFAASPTSASGFSFEGLSPSAKRAASSQRTMSSSQDPDGNVTFVVAVQPPSPDAAHVRKDASSDGNGSSRKAAEPGLEPPAPRKVQAGRGHTDVDGDVDNITTTTTTTSTSPGVPHRQTDFQSRSEAGQDIQLLFGPGEDVLY